MKSDVAELIAVPVESSRPVRAYVGVDGDGWRVYFAIDGGRRRELVGPVFPRTLRGSRQARALARQLNARGVDA